MDALEGIDEEGIQGPDKLAQEARVRSAYMEWCKDNGKEVDESRFPVFFDNFLVMEDFAKESGKPMTLNKYADCTEEEYKALTTGGEKSAAVPTKNVADLDAQVAEAVAEAAFAEAAVKAAAAESAASDAKADVTKAVRLLQQ